MSEALFTVISGSPNASIIGRAAGWRPRNAHARMRLQELFKRLLSVIVVGAFSLNLETKPVWADIPDFAKYQVDLGQPASTAQEAVNTLQKRIESVVAWNACGNEIGFLLEDGLRREVDGELKRNGEIVPTILGKIAWLGENSGGRCQHAVIYYDDEIKQWKTSPNHIDPAVSGWPDDAGLNEGDGTERLNAAFARRFGPDCDIVRVGNHTEDNRILEKVSKIDPPSLPSERRWAFELTFKVTDKCMRAQINRALMGREKVGNPGTDGLPCRLVGKARKGDWDMAVFGLVRILYLDKSRGVNAITQPTRDHVMSNVLTISGPLEPQSYGLFQCGNTENDTGSPQERADEQAFYNDGGFFDDLGDLFGWWLTFLVVVVAVALAVFALMTALGAGAAVISAAILASGVITVALTQFRVPETENHLLMINSSRYLTNQLIIDALDDEDDKEEFEGYQEEIREWLLQRFQRISEEDFIEYNSKPYQRLSIGAILNIFDFAPPDDVELRNGALIVLEFASAKFAAGSNQGRRIVPFRRLMETNRHEIWGPSTEGFKPRRVFEVEAGSDHLIAAMLLYTGQTQQLPTGERGVPGERNRVWKASVSSVSQMIWEATSHYSPHEIILDLAINKSKPYDQRIHHEGFEIYSSGKGYLISAGGIQTDFSYGALLTPAKISTDVPFDAFLKNADRGAAVPTLLIPGSNALQHRRSDFLRIEGSLREWDHEDRDKNFASDAECEQNAEKIVDGKPVGAAGDGRCKRNVTNDHNLCVRNGFACGTNLIVPPSIQGCLKRPPGAVDAWRFIDSESCLPYQGASPFFVVIFRRPCPADHEHCNDEWGFFEAVDKPPGISFDQFMQETIDRNPTALLPPPAAMVGNYMSWRNERIDFDALGHETDENESGITGVDGIDQDDIGDWPLAEGDAITADGKGRITIRSPGRQPSPGLSMRIEIDYTNWEHPKYEPKP